MIDASSSARPGTLRVRVRVRDGVSRVRVRVRDGVS